LLEKRYKKTQAVDFDSKIERVKPTRLGFYPFGVIQRQNFIFESVPLGQNSALGTLSLIVRLFTAVW
jgi:hypothetical protein